MMTVYKKYYFDSTTAAKHRMDFTFKAHTIFDWIYMVIDFYKI